MITANIYLRMKRLLIFAINGTRSVVANSPQEIESREKPEGNRARTIKTVGSSESSRGAIKLVGAGQVGGRKLERASQDQVGGDELKGAGAVGHPSCGAIKSWVRGASNKTGQTEANSKKYEYLLKKAQSVLVECIFFFYYY